MAQRFLLRGRLGLALSILVAACGGKVTVDLPTGTGGAGGTAGHGGSTSTVTFATTSTSITSTGSDTTSVSVGPGTTTGTGPATCSCQEFCAVLAGCGFPSMQCVSTCSQVPQQAIDCVCQNKASCNVQQCFGGGPGTTAGVGPASSSSVSSSSSGGVGAACSMCANGAAMGACSMAATACSNDPGCVGILQCHQMCGWTAPCKQQCEGANPASAPAFSALINCAVCQNCSADCQSSQLFDEYCLLPP